MIQIQSSIYPVCSGSCESMMRIFNLAATNNTRPFSGLTTNYYSIDFSSWGREMCPCTSRLTRRINSSRGHHTSSCH